MRERIGALWRFTAHAWRVVRLRYHVGGFRGVLLLGALGRGTGRMAEDWDRRARLNARYFVASDDWRSEEEFDRSGERVVAGKLLRDIEIARDATALEIGCGIGRLLTPIGTRVGRAIGIDVSSEMVWMARERLAPMPSVEVLLGDGSSLVGIDDQSVDFCYSYVVFQHLPSIGILTSYCREVFRVLAPGGLFRFQTQGPPDGAGARTIADAGTLRGIRVSRADLSSLLEAAGFSVLELVGHPNGAVEDLLVTARREPGPGERPTRKARYHSPVSAAPR